MNKRQRNRHSIAKGPAGLLFSKLYIRNCGDRATCSVSSSMTTSHGRVITSSTCCYTEGCSPPRPVLPPVNFKKNGVVCKTCHAMQSQPCDSDTYTDCLGNETKCLSQVSTVAGLTSTAMRGCATPSLCAIPHEEGSLEHLRFISDTTCTDGGAGLHYCLYLLGVTFIGLFKVMY
ncbi:hypothetical protein GDO81_012571 [Engystomops pustulosus]|uniref:Phospholipase A2 inhibitor and Ly6/PLAUR domain-containing protein-like n=1 Tax=Engystomops pustulosus TaxID=76066 RepID=A0AAV7BN27_ENGPU|nr:hypothetical protein GDO81_012571 [Engystomops pustulosus]